MTHQSPIVLAKPSSPSGLFHMPARPCPTTEPPQEDTDRRSRYSTDDDDVDGDGTWGTGNDDGGDETDDAMSAWLKDGRSGFPAEEDEAMNGDDEVPEIPQAPAGPADDGDEDAVLGEEWIERTIEELEDATSPQPKNRSDGADILEEWGSPDRRQDADPAAAAVSDVAPQDTTSSSPAKVERTVVADDDDEDW